MEDACRREREGGESVMLTYEFNGFTGKTLREVVELANDNFKSLGRCPSDCHDTHVSVWRGDDLVKTIGCVRDADAGRYRVVRGRMEK